jgi:hypothetical protein
MFLFLVVTTSHATDEYSPNGYQKYGIPPEKWISRVPRSPCTLTTERPKLDDPTCDERTSRSLGTFSGVFRSGGADWPLAVEVKISENYNYQQPEILRRAFDLLVRKTMNPELWECADRKGRHSRPDIRGFKDRLYQLIRAENHNYKEHRNVIYVTRFWFELTSIIGFANLSFYDRSKVFWISLNSQKIGPFGEAAGAQDDPSFWAGVIVHEIFHNLGLRHPHFDRTGERSDFIYAFGDCFEQLY